MTRGTRGRGCGGNLGGLASCVEGESQTAISYGRQISAGRCQLPALFVARSGTRTPMSCSFQKHLPPKGFPPSQNVEFASFETG